MESTYIITIKIDTTDMTEGAVANTIKRALSQGDFRFPKGKVMDFWNDKQIGEWVMTREGAESA